MKGLEALMNIVLVAVRNHLLDFPEDEKPLKEQIDIIEKELKALEIINEKNVDISRLRFKDDVDNYNLWVNEKFDKKLTQEEFNFLKEVLK